MASNINLTIDKKANKSLSLAISKYLSETLKQQSIKLSLQQWKSIFEIIKEDNATEAKQYTGGDTDITNGKHFIVKEGTYQITESAMAQIVKIAKEALGIATGEEEIATAPPPETVTPSEEGEGNLNPDAEVKQKLTDILKTVNMDFTSKSDAYKERLIKQYNNMAALATQNNQEIDQNKIIQYAKALEYREAQDEWAKATKNGTTSSTTVNVSDFTELAKGEILLADTNGDGQVSEEEYINYEKSTDPEIANTPEMETMLKATFSKLDVDGNGFIDETEEETLLRTTAGESSSDITADEWSSMQVNIITEDNLYNTKSDNEIIQELQTILDGQVDFNNKSNEYKIMLVTRYRKMNALANSQGIEVNKDDIIKYAKALEFKEAQNIWKRDFGKSQTSEGAVTFEASIGTYNKLAEGEIILADSDRDGKISKEEYKAYNLNPNANDVDQQTKAIDEAFKKLDRNKDGYIDATEEAASLYTMATIFDQENNRTMGDLTADEYVLSQQGLHVSEETINKINKIFPESVIHKINEWKTEHKHVPTLDEFDTILNTLNLDEKKAKAYKAQYKLYYSYTTYNSRIDGYYQNFKSRNGQ